MQPRIIIRHKWALGDTVLLSALIRDIHRAYPGEFQVGVDTHYDQVWLNNPYVTQFPPGTSNIQKVEVSWGKAIRNPWARVDGRLHMRHILAWYHYDFGLKTGMHIPVTEPKGELFLTDKEKEPMIEGRYWLVMAGGKQDITNKLWPQSRYQAVVDALKDRGISCVQGGASHSRHIHPPLQNCMNLVGQSNDIRDFFNLVYHADGVITPVSAGMHIAAVFDKPCVVIAGAREEPWFEYYGDHFEAFGPGCTSVTMPHKFLHTFNKLSCCENNKACWRRKTVKSNPIDIRKPNPKDFCLAPKMVNGFPVAACMELIQPEHVIEAVMEYYDANALPPVGELKKPVENLNPTPVVSNSPAQISTPPARIPTTTVQEFNPSSLRIARPGYQAPKPQSIVQKTVPAPIVPVAPPEPSRSLLDNPLIGGMFTVCTLLYGPHTAFHRRCLESILTTIPRNRIDLRVGTNAVPPETLEYLEAIKPDVTYINPVNRYKDAVMREMFHDPQHPLTSKYLVWFDDDTQVVDPKWAEVLAETIISNHPHGCRLFGDKRFHDLNVYVRPGHQPDQWFKQAAWWKNQPLRIRNSERYGPNGSCIDFVVGYFWAIHVPTIVEAQIPDARLVQAGDDIVFGEQVHQLGYKIRMLNQQKKLVWCPTREEGGRREFSKPVTVFPWAGQ